MVPATPLHQPKQYFEAVENPLPAGAALAVGRFLGVTLLFVIAVELVLSAMVGGPTGLRGEIYRLLVPVAAFMAVYLAAAWLVVAGVMHVVGGHSEGRFRDALGVTGWSYAPDLLLMPISAAAMYLEMRDRELMASDPAVFAAEVEELQAQASSIPGLLVTLVVVAWSVYILANGIQATHDTDAKAAWIAAGIVGVGAIALAIVGI
ncbi:MAG: YIP1 family protein [Halobacteriales archaeon]